jgi:tetratricopeptide (TPR) repeat protein
MERLALDHDNLRAALDWLIANGEAECAVVLAGDLWRFWQMHGDIGEGIRRLEAVAAMEGPVSSEARARILNGLTALVYRQGDLRRAAILSGDAVAFARTHKLTQELASALNNRGAMVHHVAGSTDEAIAILEESLGLHRTLGSELGVTTALHNLGRAYSSKGRYDLALRCYEEVLALRRASGDAFGIAEALNSMGLTAIRLGEHMRAVAMFEEALPIFEQAGNRGGMATILSCLGESSLAMGKPDEAIGYLDRAMQIYREIGEERGQVVVTTSRMQLALMRDDRALALQFARQAIGICLARSYRSEVIEPLFGMAQLSVGDPEVAARLLGAAEGALARLGQTTDDWEDSVISAVGERIAAAVGPDRFEQLRAEGHALSESDAEALALTVSA